MLIKNLLNKGLSKKLKIAFPDVYTTTNDIIICRPYIENKQIYDLNWLAGFIEAEGCFFVTIRNSPKSKFGQAMWLKFMVTQHKRDEILLKKYNRIFRLW